MRISNHRWVQFVGQYALSILSVVGLTALLWGLQEHLSTQVIVLVFLLPVVTSTRLWGLGPGILAAAVSFLTMNYFFIPPLYTLSVHRSQDLLVLIIFLLIAVVISQLLGRAQFSIREAMSREQEATCLYEMSIALSGQQDEASIAHILAQQIQETFLTDQIEIVVRQSLHNTLTHYRTPEEQSKTKSEVTLEIPLLTARGELGKVSLWRARSAFTISEQRLIKTFINQGALALERASLAEAENRAHILEESDHLKSALLSSVSHELRSPLATIKASISSLRSGMVEWDSDARQDLVAAIEEETDHLNLLVGNLLDMSRIETGALHPQRKWNSLSEIVGGVINRMRQSLQNHQIKLQISLDLPLLPVDYLQLEQVFTNLLSNSVKYAPPGSLIHIHALLRADQTVLVQVSNQGPSVADEHLERIFDKFYRVTAADKVTGTGLGLSICKGIIEAHGGRIWAENRPDAFVFNFTLPITWEGALPVLPPEL